MQQENLADIMHKLSIIYKHIQSMHNELRYQAKIPHLLPNFFFFLKTNKQKNNKDMLIEKEMTSNPNM